MAKVPTLKFTSTLASCHVLLELVEETNKTDLLKLLDEGVYSAVTEDLLLCFLRFYTDRITNQLLKAVVPCHLRELHVDKFIPHLTYFGLTEVIKKCPHLQKVSLKECDQLMSPGQFVLWRRIGVSITSLCLESCHNVTDQVVQSALRHIPTLQHLNVSSCENLTETVFLLNEDLQKEREFTPTLETTHQYECELVSVDISGCPGITTTAVRHLTSLTGPTLKHVNLSWTSINMIAVLSLAGYSLPAMIELVISFYSKTEGTKDPKSDELYRCLLEFKETLDKVEKQLEEHEDTKKEHKEICQTVEKVHTNDQVSSDEICKSIGTLDLNEQISNGREIDSVETGKNETSNYLLHDTKNNDNNSILESDMCSSSGLCHQNEPVIKYSECEKIPLDSETDIVKLDNVKINLVDFCENEKKLNIDHSNNDRKLLPDIETQSCLSSVEVNNGAHHLNPVPNSSQKKTDDIELGSDGEHGAILNKYFCKKCNTDSICNGASKSLSNEDVNSGLNGDVEKSKLICNGSNDIISDSIMSGNSTDTLDSIKNKNDLPEEDVDTLGRSVGISNSQLTNCETNVDSVYDLSNSVNGQEQVSNSVEGSAQTTKLPTENVKIVQTYKPSLVCVDITNKFSSVYETVGFDCLKEFLRCSPDLQKFGMSWKGLTDEMVIELSPDLKNLREISLTDCELVTFGLTEIGKTCKKLEKVDFNGIHFIKDIFLRPFLLNSDLQCLYLAECDITDGTLFRLAARKMDQFEELDLSWCDEVTEQGLNALCGKPSPIKKLSFRHCPATTLTLALMAENFKHLTRLNICSVDSITDESVVYLVENLQLLEEIDLGWNSGLSDVCVKSLLKSCIYLQKAVLSGIKYLTSTPFLPIISDLEKFRRCQALIRLKFQESKVLEENEHYSNDEEYEELHVPYRSTSYAPSLQVLELEYCDCVDDNHLAEIVAVCRGSLYIVDYFREAIKPVMIRAKKSKLFLSPSQTYR